MKNKVFIKLIVPELDSSFDLFLPVNEVIWKIKKMLAKCVSDLSSQALDFNLEYNLINKNTGKVYDNNEIVIDTDIRNATELLLLSVKDSKTNSILGGVNQV